MHYKFLNVNDAFSHLVKEIYKRRVATNKEQSRNGEVIRVDEPVLVSYECPEARVLFNSGRDCNPFFHLFEALWMLAGRNDVNTLDFYNSNMKNYSDDGKIFNGAYGYRWRRARYWTVFNEYSEQEERVAQSADQLTILIDHLKNEPNSRRAVLQMWNVEDDLFKIGPKVIHHPDENGEPTHEGILQEVSKDVCCNLSVMFSIRKEEPELDIHDGVSAGYMLSKSRFLDMTVTNRSNDMVWGMLGANYVHFTFLMEYMANCLGVEMGTYHHFTNNLHVYEENWEPEKYLKADKEDREKFYQLTHIIPRVQLVQDKDTFDKEVVRFVHSPAQEWKEPFLETVAKPACLAFALHKQRNYDQARRWCNVIAQEDWKHVCLEWIEKREKGYQAKS